MDIEKARSGIKTCLGKIILELQEENPSESQLGILYSWLQDASFWLIHDHETFILQDTKLNKYKVFLERDGEADMYLTIESTDFDRQLWLRNKKFRHTYQPTFYW
jgi:hypothetical protein